jgi:hypothetical protein
MNEDPVLDIQNAFDQAQVDGTEFAGALRAPWTIARHSAAMNLGCKVILAIGPDVRELMTTGAYSNALRDVILVLWLCSLAETEVIKLNCILSAQAEQQAITKAFGWADKIGLIYGSKLYLEGLALLDEIISGVWHSFYSTVDNGSEKRVKKNSAPPGKSESLIQPSLPADTALFT